MPLTTPTKTDGSIGRVKSDIGAAPNLDNYVPAAEYERLKDAVIDLYEHLTPIWQLEEAADMGGGVSLQRAGSSDKSGSVACTRVADPINPSEYVFRFIGTNLRGAYWLQCQGLPSPLPRKLRVEWCWCEASATLPSFWFITLAGNATDGLALWRSTSTNITIAQMQAGEMPLSGTNIAAAVAGSQTECRRRYPAQATVMRPEGTPAHWSIVGTFENGIEGGRTSQELTPPGGWDGDTFDSLGVGMFVSGASQVSTGNIDLKYLRIYDAT